MMSNAEFRIPGTRETRTLLHSFGAFGKKWLFQRFKGILPAWHHCLSQGRGDTTLLGSGKAALQCQMMRNLSLGPFSSSFHKNWGWGESSSTQPLWALLISDPAVSKSQMKPPLNFPLLWSGFQEKAGSGKEGTQSVTGRDLEGAWQTKPGTQGNSAERGWNEGKSRRLDRSTQIIESNHCHARQSTISSLETFWTFPRRVIPAWSSAWPPFPWINFSWYPNKQTPSQILLGAVQGWVTADLSPEAVWSLCSSLTFVLPPKFPFVSAPPLPTLGCRAKFFCDCITPYLSCKPRPQRGPRLQIYQENIWRAAFYIWPPAVTSKFSHMLRWDIVHF